MTYVFPEIRGSGGGGGGGGGKGSGGGSGGGGSEAPNTLRSRARARVVEVLGEGPIKGLVNGDQSIFFDYTPLRGPDFNLNFSGVEWQERKGLPDQPHLAAFPQTETTISVETRVRRSAQPVVRRIVENDIDEVRVVMRIPSLANQSSNGDIRPASVVYSIDLRVSGGVWNEVVNADLRNQKTTSPYQIQHVIPLPEGGAPYDIRVRRITQDSDSVRVQNESWWESYTLVRNGKFTYPHTALLGFQINAEDFGNNVPSRQYEVDGLIIQVPSNYDPETREYDGIWDGTFKLAWTNNPAWIFYDLITHPRYGLGEFIDATNVDKWSLYTIARYCDELVPSGFTNATTGMPIMEPRFTFNGVINSRDEAYKVLQMITSTFRGMSYWTAGMVFATADIPTDPVKLVTPANVIGGEFSYSGTAMKARHSVALVSWNDPQDFYRPAIEVVQNDEMVERFGWRPIEVQGTGITSRGQAHRYGKWILDTEQNETETVEYQASFDHADVKPGDIIMIADPRKAAVRTGGRVKSATNTTVTLDAPFKPVGGNTYSMHMATPDGEIITREIIGFEEPDAEGAFARVRFALAMTIPPEPNGMWVISGTDVAPRKYRVLEVRETDKNIFKIVALFHDPTKYARVEQNIKLEPIQYTRPNDQIRPPTNLRAVESMYFQNGVGRTRLNLSWSPSNDFLSAGYVITAETPQGRVEYGQVSGLNFDIEDPAPGDWVISVSARSVTGRLSQPVSELVEVKGWDALERPYVSHLEITGQGQGRIFGGRDARFSWRNNFPSATPETGSEPNGAGTGNINPLYRDNVVRVWDIETNQILRTQTVTTNEFFYDFSQNAADAAALGLTPRRAFRIEVTVRDQLGRESEPATLAVENPVPPLIMPTVRSNNSGAIFVEYPFPSDIDFKGALIWAEKNPNFDPETTAPAYDGPNNLVSIPADEFSTYWVRLAGYDEFGKTDLNISPPIRVETSGVVIDDTPPEIPQDLTLASAIEVSPSGEVNARLVATWAESTSENFAHFSVEIKRGSGSFIGFVTNSASYEWGGLIPGEEYTVRVRAVSKNGFASGYTAEASITMPPNSQAPDAPADLSAMASLQSVFLSWSNPPQPDLAFVEIWSSTTDDRASASLIGTSQGSAFTHAGVATGVERFYWVRAVNTSALASPWSSLQGVAVTPGQVQEGDVAANAITADKIRAEEITGDKIKATTSFPISVTVGNTGVTIGDPAGLINLPSNTTLIDPGKILINGSTPLSSWRAGPDLTEINGGAVAANTITANKVAIGLRGIDMTGIQFETINDQDKITWSAGEIIWTGDDGNTVTTAVSAGEAEWTAGTVFVSWQRGQGALSHSSTRPTAADTIVLATYRGGSNMVANYGRTLIDGDQIKTGTIKARMISAEELITSSAQIRGGVIENVNLAGNITFDKLTGGTLSTTEKVRVGGDRFILDADSQTLRIYDQQAIGQATGELSAGQLRVRIGKLGDGDQDYGLNLYDASGNLIFGSGGWGSSVIPPGALTTVPASTIDGNLPSSQVSGLGSFANISQITDANISTFIETAAISDAYIANLHGDKITANTLDADRLKANTITARELSTGQLITDSAQIGNAVIDTAQIKDLSVDTIKIKNGAVTSSGAVTSFGTTVSLTLTLRAGARVAIFAKTNGNSLNTLWPALVSEASISVTMGGVHVAYAHSITVSGSDRSDPDNIRYFSATPGVVAIGHAVAPVSGPTTFVAIGNYGATLIVMELAK